MIQKMGHLTILVRDYDEAIRFYTEVLGFKLTADNQFGNGQRWVSVAPYNQKEIRIVFVIADTPKKLERVGNAVADHVLLVLETDNCLEDYQLLKSKGVNFFGEPEDMPWGIEVVFEDLYGNRFDLLQIKS